MKRIVPHNPDWVRLFSAEEQLLADVLEEIATGIHHMGSTAIKNIPAKPIIDVLLEASSLDAIDDREKALALIGYVARGEYGIADRRYFKKIATDDAPAFHLHCYLAGSYQINRHLAFRDYLRLKPDIAAEYAHLKTDLTDKDGNLFSTYQAAKAPFVDGIALQAVSYFSKSN